MHMMKRVLDKSQLSFESTLTKTSLADIIEDLRKDAYIFLRALVTLRTHVTIEETSVPERDTPNP